jgi:hypothetical protein
MMMMMMMMMMMLAIRRRPTLPTGKEFECMHKLSPNKINKITSCEFFFRIFKEYVQFLNKLYDITWFGAAYA